jgi:lysophospholipase L1-like esterase
MDFVQEDEVNIIDNKIINKGVGWAKNESFYSGSELSFSFSKSGKIKFKVISESESDQGIEILIDDKKYHMSSPDLNSQLLTIMVDEHKPHNVTIRHYCIRLMHECQIKIEGIYLDKDHKLYAFQSHNKLLSILGDSISTIYGNKNYSHLLANNLGYELRNASIMESTVSMLTDNNSAINRYKNDLMNLDSDVIIIFMGSNDAFKAIPIGTFEEKYSTIVSDLQRNNPDTKMFLVSILPRIDVESSILDTYNQTIKEVAARYKINFIDSSGWINENHLTDGVHPSFDSQQILANKIGESILKSLR